MKLRALAGVFLVAAALALSGCGGQTRAIAGDDERGDAVVVGSFDFIESRLLAELYVQALEAEGIDARHAGTSGPREVMQPALEQGHIDLLPEYLGAAYTFLHPTSSLVPAGEEAALAALSLELTGRELTALTPARAQDKNAFAMLRTRAEDLGIEQLSDLVPHADSMTFGGPPECAARALCLRGLEETYGLNFDRFVPLDAGGPLTVAALRGDEVDVALLFTTGEGSGAPDLILLRDNKRLQPAENVVPVVRNDALQRAEAAFRTAAERVSALTTRSLRRMNARLDRGLALTEVAAKWLQAHPGGEPDGR